MLWTNILLGLILFQVAFINYRVSTLSENVLLRLIEVCDKLKKFEHLYQHVDSIQELIKQVCINTTCIVNIPKNIKQELKYSEFSKILRELESINHEVSNIPKKS